MFVCRALGRADVGPDAIRHSAVIAKPQTRLVGLDRDLRRDSWWDGDEWTSYSELMGMPDEQLSTSYYFPAYNNVNLDDQLRIARP